MAGARARSHGLIWGLSALLALANPAWAWAGPANSARPPQGGTLSLAIANLRFAIHQTAEGQECPEGFNAGQRENYLKQFPTYTARTANEIRHGYGYGNRGPNGENALYNPEMVVDPIPFKLATGTTAPGINLDGKVDDKDFVSPDGRTGVDNQMYRVLGCTAGYRGKEGYFYVVGNRHVRDLNVNRMIFEISGIDDLKNDPDVTVRTYRGLDPLVFSATDEATPGTTQHIDQKRGQRYMTQTKGRIVDGVLMTDPVDLRLPWNRNAANCCEIAYTGEFTLRGMQLRVKLGPTGGEGDIGGYADLPTWWNWFSRVWAQGAPIEVLVVSPPSLWRALTTQADAYPDEHGVNTAISMALTTKFVKVIVAQDDQPAAETRIAGAATRETSR